jgi:hypothetical protein
VGATAQSMIWAVGLRGAVAYGLALNLPQIEGESDEGIPAIESATLVIVVASTLLLGGATGPLLRYLDLQVSYLWFGISFLSIKDIYFHRHFQGYQAKHTFGCLSWELCLGTLS